MTNNTPGGDLPNLDKSTANLSKITDKDEWLKDVRGEDAVEKLLSGMEVAIFYRDFGVLNEILKKYNRQPVAPATIEGITMKAEEGKINLFWSNGVHIGFLYPEVDGHYVFDGIEKKGSWPSYALREIADAIDKLNNPWDDKVKEYFKSEAATIEGREGIAKSDEIVDVIIYAVTESNDNGDQYGLIKEKVKKIINFYFTTRPQEEAGREALQQVWDYINEFFKYSEYRGQYKITKYGGSLVIKFDDGTKAKLELSMWQGDQVTLDAAAPPNPVAWNDLFYRYEKFKQSGKYGETLEEFIKTLPYALFTSQTGEQEAQQSQDPIK